MRQEPPANSPYRGRLAPSPTGYLHLGHAQTFWIAAERAQYSGGELIYRLDDLDRTRCRTEFAQAAIEDLHWLGIHWAEGPDVGGPHVPYEQSARREIYRSTLEKLHAGGWIFPCERSRRDVLEAVGAPHEGGENDEPVYPLAFRPPPDAPLPPLHSRLGCNWRFRVPEGRALSFTDACCGVQQAVAGGDFGDFLVWRKDDVPSYQLACVVDDASMGITEVVRGADLIQSTFRQLLLYEALELPVPRFYHCPLVRDDHGVRLAKRHDALSLRTFRAAGHTPESLLAQFAANSSSA